MFRLVIEPIVALIIICFVVGVVGFCAGKAYGKKLKQNVIGTMKMISDGQEEYLCVECPETPVLHDGEIVCFVVDLCLGGKK